MPDQGGNAKGNSSQSKYVTSETDSHHLNPRCASYSATSGNNSMTTLELVPVAESWDAQNVPVQFDDRLVEAEHGEVFPALNKCRHDVCSVQTKKSSDAPTIVLYFAFTYFHQMNATRRIGLPFLCGLVVQSVHSTLLRKAVQTRPFQEERRKDLEVARW